MLYFGYFYMWQTERRQYERWLYRDILRPYYRFWDFRLKLLRAVCVRFYKFSITISGGRVAHTATADPAEFI